MAIKRTLLLPTAVILVGVGILAGTNAYLAHWAAQPLPARASVDFVIAPGETFSAIAATLGDLNVVSPAPFSLRAKQRGLQASVRSGEYRLAPGETADGLLDRLVAGDVLQHRLRIAEGSRVADLLAQLAADARLAFDLEGATADDLLARLQLGEGHAEGAFFPDTYLFARGDAASSVLRRAHAKMATVLAAAWAARSDEAAAATPLEALVLASIVEKETSRRADRAKVAGVFTRRLGKSMRLQSDPTVIYGLGERFDGNLTRAHLNADGPYNTYRRKGLPPTPIALPSLASIEAALHPDDGDALYFVARGDGSSEFSRTLAEHNDAVRRYQLRR